MVRVDYSKKSARLTTLHSSARLGVPFCRRAVDKREAGRADDEGLARLLIEVRGIGRVWVFADPLILF